MSEPSADVSRPVAYSIDRWFMDHVPWAMWFFVIGLFIAMHAEGHSRNAALLAFIYLGGLGLAFAGWAATTLVERSTPFFLGAVIGLGIFVLVALAIVLLTGSDGRSSSVSYGTRLWSDLVNPPADVFAWMMMYLGLGFAAYAIGRHLRPGTPVILASPAGLVVHKPWLRNILIPWSEIHRVGHVDLSLSGQPPSYSPHAVAVDVTEPFYERNIAPKRSMLAPPGAEMMFRRKDGMVQVVLSCPELIVDPEHLRAPIDARWNAYRAALASPTPAGGAGCEPITYGRWAFEGTTWQTAMFLAPLVALLVALLNAPGLWPGR